MEKLKIEYVGIDTIHPYKNNAKQHPKEQIEQIKESIRQFGMDDPIGVWNNEIVEGHGRLMACKELGMTEVPIIRLDHLTDEERKAYTLAHNQLTMNSDFDIDILNQELESFQTIDMTAFGFEISSNLDELDDIVEDEPPEAPEEPKAKLGDIYQLGNHRLMCGDSTNKNDVEKLMNEAEADLVVTDPPYNVNYGDKADMLNRYLNDNGSRNTSHIENDNMTSVQFIEFLKDAFENMKEALKPGGAFYIFHASATLWEFEEALRHNGLQQRQQIIWNKNSLVLGRQDYQWKHEPCLYGWKDGASHYFIDRRTETTIIEDNPPDLNKMTKDEMKKMLQEIFSEAIPKTVIDEQRPNKNDIHPTMKPIRLIARLIRNSSQKGESVLDLFGGSGSTLIACEQLQRKCYMMEYDSKYVDVIIDRWETLTGQKAEKLEG